MRHLGAVWVAVVGASVVAGCATEVERQVAAVDVDDDRVGAEAAYTNGEGWTINAAIDYDSQGTVIGSYTLAGGSGTTPAGICILRRTGEPCSGDNATGDSECGGAGRRCLRSDNAGAAYCHTQVACSSGFRSAGTYSVTAPGITNEHYTANACFGGACSGGRSTSPTIQIVFRDDCGSGCR